MKKSERYMRKIVRHIRKTYKNKLLGLGFLTLGIISTMATQDLTVLIFLGLIGIALLFAKENWTLF